MSHDYLETLENQLKEMNQIETNCLEKNKNCLYEYLFALAYDNSITLTNEQKENLKNEIESISQNIKDYLNFIEIIRIAMKSDSIKPLLKYSKMYNFQKKYGFFKSIFIALKILLKRDKQNENFVKINFVTSFIIYYKNFFNQTEFPYELINLLSNIPSNSFNQYQKLLTYFSDYKILSIQRKFKLDINFLPLEKKDIDTSFTFVTTMLRKKILHQIERNKEIRKTVNNQIQAQRRKRKNQFLKYRDLDFDVEKYPELLEFYLLSIITHNDNYLNKLEMQLEQEEQKWSSEIINLFLDYNYNFFLLKEEEQKRIIEKYSFEELKQLLEILHQKEFSFLDINHPLFTSILLNTNPQTLNNLLEKIQNCSIPKDFIIKNPQICYEKFYQFLIDNQKSIKLYNMNIMFFWNSNLLLLPNDTFIQYLNIIKSYQCSNMEYQEGYFDNLDQKIEKRFDTEVNFPSYIEPETETLLEKENPINLNDQNPFIEYLDQNYKIDLLRYAIAGIIITK